MQAQELWNCLPPPPQCSCFYLEPNHSAATTNAHSSWCIHGAKAKPISLLWKLFHQYFYIYCCFFFQTAYQRHLLKRNICFLSFKDEETLVTQYRILHRKFWRTMKDNQMLLLKSKGYNPRGSIHRCICHEMSLTQLFTVKFLYKLGIVPLMSHITEG